MSTKRGRRGSTERRQPTEVELAEMSIEELEAWADEEFDTEPEPLEPPAPRRLDAIISVRFSADELEQLRTQAEAADMKVTAYIRTVVLQHAGGPVIDRAALLTGLARVSADVRALEQQLA